ncbi:hypothetical protein GW17_00029374 [Ensete ventricosum]|nr:hypothetical protein GW17_00029374 [Ensete ventricosum]
MKANAGGGTPRRGQLCAGAADGVGVRAVGRDHRVRCLHGALLLRAGAVGGSPAGGDAGGAHRQDGDGVVVSARRHRSSRDEDEGAAPHRRHSWGLFELFLVIYVVSKFLGVILPYLYYKMAHRDIVAATHWQDVLRIDSW